VNKEYIESHSRLKIRIEMDEMGSFYGNKTHQVWLWWAIDHESGEVIAYWFGTREHHYLDALIALNRISHWSKRRRWGLYPCDYREFTFTVKWQEGVGA
jgi:IS1 family transposase